MGKKFEGNTMTLGILLAIVGGICWGISGVSGAYMFSNYHVSSEWMVNVRLLLSGIGMLIPVYIKYKKDNKDFFVIWKNLNNIPTLLFFSIVGLGMCQYTYFSAIKLSNAATATVIQYTAPAFILIYYCFIERKLPTLKQIVSLALAMLGVLLLATKGNITSLSISRAALIYSILAALTMVVFNVSPVKLMIKYGTAYVVGWGMLIAGIFMAPIGKPWFFHQEWSWDFYATIAFVVVILIGTICAFGLYMGGVKYAGAEIASMVACIEPLTATFATAIVMGTRFVMAEFIGIGVILLAVLLLSLKAKNSKAI